MAYIFAPAAVFLAPFLNFIAYQDYHPLRPEVLMAAGVVLLAGILLGAVMALRPATLGQILLVAAVIAALDMSLPAFSLRALARPSLAPWPTLAWHWAVVVGLLVAPRGCSIATSPRSS